MTYTSADSTAGKASGGASTFPGVISNPDPNNSTPGSLVFQTGGGDNFEGDTAFSSTFPYLDLYGLVLAVGTSTGGGGTSPLRFQRLGKLARELASESGGQRWHRGTDLYG